MGRSFLALKFTPKSERRLLSLCINNTDNDPDIDKWNKNAVQYLVRKLRKEPRLIDELEKAITQSCSNTKCVSLPITADNRLLIAHRRGLPQVIYCRLWRWPDLQSHHQMKAISTCESSVESTLGVERPPKAQKVCVNPYHYERSKPKPIEPILITTSRIPPDLTSSFEDSDTTGGTRARAGNFVSPQAGLTRDVEDGQQRQPAPASTTTVANNTIGANPITSTTNTIDTTPTTATTITTTTAASTTSTTNNTTSTTETTSHSTIVGSTIGQQNQLTQSPPPQYPPHSSDEQHQQHQHQHQHQDSQLSPYQQFPHFSPQGQLSPQHYHHQQQLQQQQQHQHYLHQQHYHPQHPQQHLHQQQQPMQQVEPQYPQSPHQDYQHQFYQHPDQMQQQQYPAPTTPFQSLHQPQFSPQPQVQQFQEQPGPHSHEIQPQTSPYMAQTLDQYNPQSQEQHYHIQDQFNPQPTPSRQQQFKQEPQTHPQQPQPQQQPQHQQQQQDYNLQPLQQPQPQQQPHQQHQDYNIQIQQQPQQQQQSPQTDTTTGPYNYGQLVMSTEIARPFRFKQNRFAHLARARHEQGVVGRYPRQEPHSYVSAPYPYNVQQSSQMNVAYTPNYRSRQPGPQHASAPISNFAQQSPGLPQPLPQTLQNPLQQPLPHQQHVHQQQQLQQQTPRQSIYGQQHQVQQQQLSPGGSEYTTLYSPQHQQQQVQFQHQDSQMQLDYQPDQPVPNMALTSQQQQQQQQQSPSAQYYELVPSSSQSQEVADQPMDQASMIDIREVPYTEGAYWCSISYHEYDQRIGEKYHSNCRVVSVDGYTQPMCSDRFCIGGISNINRNQFTEWVRRRIGRGVRFTYVDGEVYVEGLSESSIFVSNPLQTEEDGDQLVEHVSKLTQGCSTKVFSTQQFSKLLSNAVSKEFEAVYKLTNCCVIRVSFVKGWGRSYKRQSIFNTPCWVELQLNGPLQWIDKVLRQMRPPTSCGSTS